MNNRIKELRTQLKLSQKKFGEAIGLTSTGICDIESGKTKTITEGNIMLICKTFAVNENWLRTGEGAPFASYEHRQDLTDLEKEILTKFHLLDSAQQKAVETIINGLYLQHNQE